jgi:hypothetical protein
MKTVEQVREEVEALKRLAAADPDDTVTHADVAAQIRALAWVSDFEVE